jgi:hypothetical protein
MAAGKMAIAPVISVAHEPNFLGKLHEDSPMKTRR